jgi:hypothetical protein
MKIIYAEDIGNYWQTSKSGPDSWIDKAKKEIASIGGKIITELYGMDETGRSAFSLVFSIGADTFKIVWPVLPSRTGNERAAKVQASTMLYHDVKHKVVMAKVKGTRTSFFEYLMLPDGQTMSNVSGDRLLELAPRMIGSGK